MKQAGQEGLTYTEAAPKMERRMWMTEAMKTNVKELSSVTSDNQ